MQNRIGDIARGIGVDRDPLTNKEDEADPRGETKEKRSEREGNVQRIEGIRAAAAAAAARLQ